MFFSNRIKRYKKVIKKNAWFYFTLIIPYKQIFFNFLLLVSNAKKQFKFTIL